MKILETFKNTGDFHECLPDYPQFKSDNYLAESDDIIVHHHRAGEGFRVYDKHRDNKPHNVNKVYVIQQDDGRVRLVFHF